MDKEQFIKSDVKNKKIKPEKIKTDGFSLHTNPILQQMLNCNELSKKMKFKLKDLY